MNFLQLSVKFIIIIIIIIITEHGFFLCWDFPQWNFFDWCKKKLVISYSMDLELGD